MRDAARDARLTGSRFGAYVVGEVLGRGQFSTVFDGRHHSSGERVAIKVEAKGIRPRLQKEAQVYRSLGHLHVPRMRWFGRARGHVALIMDIMGPDLRSVHRESKLRLGLDAVRHVGAEVLDRLQRIHGCGWLHLDIKPANIVAAGIKSASGRPSCHVIDFGHARRWPDEDSASSHRIVGTARFASLANHLGEPLGRRDDLESLALSLAFLHQGRLPWSGLMAPSKQERFALMLDAKQNASLEDITGTLPTGFVEYMRAVRRLRYDEEPPYSLLRTLLQGEE